MHSIPILFTIVFVFVRYRIDEWWETTQPIRYNSNFYNPSMITRGYILYASNKKEVVKEIIFFIRDRSKPRNHLNMI